MEMSLPRLPLTRFTVNLLGGPAVVEFWISGGKLVVGIQGCVYPIEVRPQDRIRVEINGLEPRNTPVDVSAYRLIAAE